MDLAWNRRPQFAILCYEKEYEAFVQKWTLYEDIANFFAKHFQPENIPTIEKAEIVEDEFERPSYTVPSTGASVTASNAIALVNKYCSKLPSDIFTKLVPQVRVFPSGGLGYKAELTFPINSPVRETITLDTPETSKLRAIRAVALKACEVLHKYGELNDDLQVPSRRSTLIKEMEEEELLEKKRYLYSRKISRYFDNAVPKVGQACFVYAIEMKLIPPEEKNGKEKNEGEEQQVVVFPSLDPSEMSSSFGFLSSVQLPPIPGFPIFHRRGKMMVHFRLCSQSIILDSDDMIMVERFHLHIFNDILGVSSDLFEFLPIKSEMPLLIVPLRKLNSDCKSNGSFEDGIAYELNKEILHDTIRFANRGTTPPPESDLESFKFEKSTYVDAVVIPWYRNGTNYYYVSKVCSDRNPGSAFPDAEYTTFNEYFYKKYAGRVIHNQEQYLLDVDHASARKNLLRSRKPCKPKPEGQRQLLVPELVYVHPFSAPYFELVISLPTIFYRLNGLLLANELRVKIVESAFEMKLVDRSDWEDLDYDDTKKEDSNTDKDESFGKKDGIKFDDTPIIGIREDDEDYFPIGVWNPADGKEFMNNDVTIEKTVDNTIEHFPSLPQSRRLDRRRKRNGNLIADEALSEIRAIGQTSALRSNVLISDDEDDDDCDILMDAKDSMHKELAYLRESIFEDEMRVTGWDDSRLAVAEINETDNAKFNLPVSANEDEIDVTALMQDIGQNYDKMSYSYVTNSNNTGMETRLNIMKNMIEEADVLDPSIDGFGKEIVINLLEFAEPFEKRKKDVLLEEINTFNTFMKSETGKSVDPEFDSLDISASREQEYVIRAPELEMTFSFNKDDLPKMGNSQDVPSCAGVSPAILMQALTTSSAGDGINLERFETIGDSFLKLAVTNYFYHKNPNEHEGKLSFYRSKEVSNIKLFEHGRSSGIPYLMESTKFDPNNAWFPPGYASTTAVAVEPPLPPLLIEEEEDNDENDDPNLTIKEKKVKKLSKTPPKSNWGDLDEDTHKTHITKNGVESVPVSKVNAANNKLPQVLLHDALTQQTITNKSVADCVEALIGAHLVHMGSNAALKFMNWLGIKVLTEKPDLSSPLQKIHDEADKKNYMKSLHVLYEQFHFKDLEDSIQYTFGKKHYLIQAFTHASYYKNGITNCYQRLEFLGDAVLDYLITRFLFEHKDNYCPGKLTDLRSALVNNTIFASMAVKYGLHRHFLSLCPGLYHMIAKFVHLCQTRDDEVHCTNFDDNLTEEDNTESEEDVEVPKALGDIFESLAGAVYLDCGMDLDVVWRVFYRLMKTTIDKCRQTMPQSPIRELFEQKDVKIRFTKLERIIQTGKVRVTVEVAMDGETKSITGMGRSYRIAKCTAARKALPDLRQKLAAKKAAADAAKKKAKEIIKPVGDEKSAAQKDDKTVIEEVKDDKESATGEVWTRR